MKFAVRVFGAVQARRIYDTMRGSVEGRAASALEVWQVCRVIRWLSDESRQSQLAIWAAVAGPTLYGSGPELISNGAYAQ